VPGPTALMREGFQARVQTYVGKPGVLGEAHFGPDGSRGLFALGQRNRRLLPEKVAASLAQHIFPARSLEGTRRTSGATRDLLRKPRHHPRRKTVLSSVHRNSGDSAYYDESTKSNSAGDFL
jgi:hypothetical protein